MHRISIAVAGCGPAGLAAALLLHRDGHDVTLFERFDAPQPLGSGLLIQPTGMAVLERLGLARELCLRGARIEALKGLQEHGRVALDAHYEDLGIAGAFGLGVHRASLFAVLYDAVQAEGIAVRTGRSVAGFDSDHNACRLHFADGEESQDFGLVVDATGWGSSLQLVDTNVLQFGALWATLPLDRTDGVAANLLEQRYSGASKMAGLLPIGRRNAEGQEEVAFFWSLRGDGYAAWRAAPLGEWKAEVRALWPATEPLLDRVASHDAMTFARYAHRTARQRTGERLFAIGDAWHSASPQLGQGANMALLDAWALAAGLREGRKLHDGLRLARAWREPHVKLYQAITALFTPLYQSNAALTPLVRDRVLAPLSRLYPVNRIQASLMSGLFGSPLPILGLSLPDYAAIASSIAPRTSGSAQSRSPVTRQTSLPAAS